MPVARPAGTPTAFWPQAGCEVSYKDASGQTVTSIFDSVGKAWTTPPQAGSGWGFQILPFIEQQSLQAANSPVLTRSTPQDMFICPSRATKARLGGGHDTARNGAPFDYAAVMFWPPSQINGDSFSNAIVDGKSWLEWSRDSMIVASEPVVNGIGGVDNAIKITDAVDGTSNTLLIGEKWMRPDEYTGGAWNDDHNLISSQDPDIARRGDLAPVPDSTDGTGREGASDYNNPCCDWWNDPLTRKPSARKGGRFGSVHPTGMASVFCDGSVKMISFSISDAMFFRVANRRDGGTIDLGQ
jgi:hypothetical protein